MVFKRIKVDRLVSGRAEVGQGQLIWVGSWHSSKLSMLPRPNPDSQLAPQHLRVKWSGNLLDWCLHARLYSRYNHMCLGFHAGSSKLGCKPHFPSPEPRLGTDAWHLRGRWTVIHEVMSLLSAFLVPREESPQQGHPDADQPRTAHRLGQQPARWAGWG